MSAFVFAKSSAGFFVRSTNNARNPGRRPTGEFITYINLEAHSNGFFGFTENGSLDFSKWYPTLTISEAQTWTGTPKYRTVVISFPDFYQNRDGRPPSVQTLTDEIQTTYLPADVEISIQVKSSTNIVITYRDYGFTEWTLSGEPRTHGKMMDDIDRYISDLIDFPGDRPGASFYYDLLDPEVLSTPRLQFGTPISRPVASAVGYNLLGIQIPAYRVFYPPIFASAYAVKTKARYKRSAPSTAYLYDEKRSRGVTSQTTLLGTELLPNGIDVAEPPDWNRDVSMLPDITDVNIRSILASPLYGFRLNVRHIKVSPPEL